MIQYNNFLMKREQSRAGSRFAECEKSRLKAKIIITLALLLTAVTGAWAQEEYESFDLSSANTNVNGTHFTITGTSGMNNYGLFLSGESVTVTSLNGENITRVEFIIGLGKSKAENITGTPGTNSCTNGNENGSITDINATSVTLSTENTGTTSVSIKQITVYYCNSEPAAPTVEPVEGKTNQWTFSMPGSDVVLTPLYAPTAAFATTGSGSEVTTLLPAAAEGVIAGTDAPLIVEGTVAFAGTSTEVTQGTVMYAVTSTNQAEAPALTEFSADVPTAKDIADDGADVLVWYYIQGADAPDGQQATADNTFNNSDIESLKVSVRSNKFDLAFMAANANTVEAGKATVTVAGTAATVTDGKIKAVKMGSEVKMTAAQGYKFRKVEVKKGGAPATPEGPTLAQTLTTANMTVKVYYIYTDMNNTCEFLSNGDGTYTFQSGTGLVGGNDSKAKALVVENGKLVFKQNFFETLSKLWNQVGFSVTFDTSENTYSIWKGSNETINATLSKVEVNGTQIALTQQ